MVDRYLSSLLGVGFDESLQVTNRLTTFWDEEAVVCSQNCERHPRNYHCWVYRWWCFSKIRSSLIIKDPRLVGYAYDENLPISNLDKKELKSVHEWIKCHPADYAAMHYFHILAKLVCTKDRLCDMALAELARTKVSINTLYANYESIWNHRRWCITTLAEADKMQPIENELKILNKLRKQSDGNSVVTALVDRQAKWLSRNLRSTAESSK
ncbi:hypothetical protein H4R24_002904 [Coemansia sp. RSA 988]|nr:hypothetical protein H4R24_002904 [Coemansia sp. RSA 988]